MIEMVLTSSYWLEEIVLEALVFIDEGVSKDEVNRRKNIVKRYFNLIMESYVRVTGDNVIRLANLEEYIAMILRVIFRIEGFKEKFNSKDFWVSLYISILMRENKEAGRNGVFNENVMSLDYCYFYISLGFYDYDALKISEFLVSDDRKTKDILKNWLKERVRFHCCNYLLGVVLILMKRIDGYFYENFNDLFRVMNQTSSSLLVDKQYKNISNDKMELPKISKDELDSLIEDFFKNIKAPEWWNQEYIDLKEKGKIRFIEGDTSLINKSIYHADTGIIEIDLRGNITDFPTLVHELTHYFVGKTKRDNFILDELPSIYMEEMALSYLESIGYDKKLIEFMQNHRVLSNFSVYESLFHNLTLVNKYKKKGIVTKEDLMQPFIETNKEFKEWQEKMINLALKQGRDIPETLSDDYSINPEEAAIDMVDREIDNIIGNGNMIFDGCQYLLGTMITKELMNRPKEEVLPEMFNLINKIDEYDLERVVNSLEIDILKKDKKEERVLKKG